MPEKLAEETHAEVAPLKCRICGYKALAPQNPNAGDFLRCPKCGVLGVFREDGGVRPPTDAELMYGMTLMPSSGSVLKRGRVHAG